jgi:hypothetical protein
VRSTDARNIHETIETLIGADVHLSPAAGEDTPKGEVKDLLIAPDGRVEWAVIGCDGKQALVPGEKLSWDAEKERFHAGITKADLESKPDFDLGKARESGLCEAIERVETQWNVQSRKKAREAATRAGEKRYMGTTFLEANGFMVCGSELDELELYGMNEEFGGVAKTLVNPAAMRVDFVIVSRGGVAGVGDTRYLVPFRAAKLCHEPLKEDQKPKDAKLMLCVDKPVATLESAPKYEEPEDDEVLVSAANRTAAERFFGVAKEPETDKDSGSEG